MALEFTTKTDDVAVIDQIAARAVVLDQKVNGTKARSELHHRMNISACHANGTPLRLRDLLESDDFNFAHDVFGIDRHIDRETGELTDFFSPRFHA